MKASFPFCAIVGQPLLKTALLACTVAPTIGGVLVRGDKGTAKSTAARALAEVLPQIQRTRHCKFNCRPGANLPECDACSQPNRQTEYGRVPFINLPLGATEDRVIGSLDFEQALKSAKRAFQPGLLAAAHQGILYIDEVNLLPDHLVDVLLDAAASGFNSIEREGISFAHPSSFTLVGTMNLEEGDLRPQLLDRFGLLVEVQAPCEAEERAEIVKRRIAFERDPQSFTQQYTSEQKRTTDMIAAAQRLISEIVLSESHLLFISALCARLQVKSLRADVVIAKTARALAALDNRTEVTETDIDKAARLALPHRLRTRPGEQSSLEQNRLDQTIEQLRQDLSTPPADEDRESETDARDREQSNGEGGDEVDILPAGHRKPVAKVNVQANQSLLTSGRRSSTINTARGAFTRAVKPAPGVAGSPAIEATIKHTITRTGGTLDVETQDLHIKQRTAKTANTVLFVVDASGSMSAMKRMSAVKGAVISLLEDSYKCRDTVGVISFRGKRAELVLGPTRSTDLAMQKLESMPTGGTTPLANAIELACRTLSRAADAGHAPLLVLLTDGKTNVALSPDGDAWADALSACDQLRQVGIAALIVDTEQGFVLLGQARGLADAMGGQYIKLDDLTAENLRLTVKSRLPIKGTSNA